MGGGGGVRRERSAQVVATGWCWLDKPATPLAKRCTPL